MFYSTQNKGLNPFTVNFFSFCGHGLINSRNEAIFLIPQYVGEDDNWVLKTLNVDLEAKRFATKENSINIFLFSACRDSIEKLIPSFRKKILIDDENF